MLKRSPDLFPVQPAKQETTIGRCLDASRESEPYGIQRPGLEAEACRVTGELRAWLRVDVSFSIVAAICTAGVTIARFVPHLHPMLALVPDEFHDLVWMGPATLLVLAGELLLLGGLVHRPQALIVLTGTAATAVSAGVMLVPTSLDVGADPLYTAVMIAILLLRAIYNVACLLPVFWIWSPDEMHATYVRLKTGSA